MAEDESLSYTEGDSSRNVGCLGWIGVVGLWTRFVSFLQYLLGTGMQRKGQTIRQEAEMEDDSFIRDNASDLVSFRGARLSLVSSSDASGEMDVDPQLQEQDSFSARKKEEELKAPNLHEQIGGVPGLRRVHAATVARGVRAAGARCFGGFGFFSDCFSSARAHFSKPDQRVARDVEEDSECSELRSHFLY